MRVEDIVREAGAAKGTFYVCFPTWDDLLEELRSRVIVAFDAAHPMPAETAADVDWAGLFDQLAIAFVDAVVALGGLHTVLWHTDFAHRRPVAAADDPVVRLTAVIRAGQKAGAFARVEAQMTARLLFAAIHETADAVVGGAPRSAAIKAMKRILRRALARDDA